MVIIVMKTISRAMQQMGNRFSKQNKNKDSQQNSRILFLFFMLFIFIFFILCDYFSRKQVPNTAKSKTMPLLTDFVFLRLFIFL